MAPARVGYEEESITIVVERIEHDRNRISVRRRGEISLEAARDHRAFLVADDGHIDVVIVVDETKLGAFGGRHAFSRIDLEELVLDLDALPSRVVQEPVELDRTAGAGDLVDLFPADSLVVGNATDRSVRPCGLLGNGRLAGARERRHEQGRDEGSGGWFSSDAEYQK